MIGRKKNSRDVRRQPSIDRRSKVWGQATIGSENATNQPLSTVELGYMCPRGISGPTAVTLTK